MGDVVNLKGIKDHGRVGWRYKFKRLNSTVRSTDAPSKSEECGE